MISSFWASASSASVLLTISKSSFEGWSFYSISEKSVKQGATFNFKILQIWNKYYCKTTYLVVWFLLVGVGFTDLFLHFPGSASSSLCWWRSFGVRLLNFSRSSSWLFGSWRLFNNVFVRVLFFCWSTSASSASSSSCRRYTFPLIWELRITITVSRLLSRLFASSLSSSTSRLLSSSRSFACNWIFASSSSSDCYRTLIGIIRFFFLRRGEFFFAARTCDLLDRRFSPFCALTLWQLLWWHLLFYFVATLLTFAGLSFLIVVAVLAVAVLRGIHSFLLCFLSTFQYVWIGDCNSKSAGLRLLRWFLIIAVTCFRRATISSEQWRVISKSHLLMKIVLAVMIVLHKHSRILLGFHCTRSMCLRIVNIVSFG